MMVGNSIVFFFNVEIGVDTFVTTNLFSQKTLHGPFIGMPNILSLYWSVSNILMYISIAINSDPKVEDSTVLCTLDTKFWGNSLSTYDDLSLQPSQDISTSKLLIQRYHFMLTCT